MNNKPARRWWQISLRTGLLLMLIACVYAAGWTAGHRGASQQLAPVWIADLDSDGDLDV